MAIRNWGDWQFGSQRRRSSADRQQLQTLSPVWNNNIGYNHGFATPPAHHISWTQRRMTPGIDESNWGQKIENVMTNIAFKGCHDLRNGVVKIYQRNRLFNEKRQHLGELMRTIRNTVAEVLDNDFFQDLILSPAASQLCYLIEAMAEKFLWLIYVDPVRANFPSCLPKINCLDETGKFLICFPGKQNYYMAGCIILV